MRTHSHELPGWAVTSRTCAAGQHAEKRPTSVTLRRSVADADRLACRANFAGHRGAPSCDRTGSACAERVRSLALFGALLAPPDAARQGLKTRAAKARDEGMFGIADAIVQGSLSSSTREQLPIVVAFVRESLLAQDPEGYARSCEALAAAAPAAIDGIDVPTMLIAGDEDAVAPVQVAHEIARRIGSAQVEVLSRCGHWMTASARRNAIALAPVSRALDGKNLEEQAWPTRYYQRGIFDGSGDQPYAGEVLVQVTASRASRAPLAAFFVAHLVCIGRDGDRRCRRYVDAGHGRGAHALFVERSTVARFDSTHADRGAHPLVRARGRALPVDGLDVVRGRCDGKTAARRGDSQRDQRW